MQVYGDSGRKNRYEYQPNPPFRLVELNRGLGSVIEAMSRDQDAIAPGTPEADQIVR